MGRRAAGAAVAVLLGGGLLAAGPVGVAQAAAKRCAVGHWVVVKETDAVTRSGRTVRMSGLAGAKMTITATRLVTRYTGSKPLTRTYIADGEKTTDKDFYKGTLSVHAKVPHGRKGTIAIKRSTYTGNASSRSVTVFAGGGALSSIWSKVAPADRAYAPGKSTFTCTSIRLTLTGRTSTKLSNGKVVKETDVRTLRRRG